MQLTSQELIFAATALRAEARRSSERAMDNRYGSTCEIFAVSASNTAELAEKIQRIAEQVSRLAVSSVAGHKATTALRDT